MRGRGGGVNAKDAALLCVLAAIAACLHGAVLWGGRTYFTNDLIHINHPWRVMTEEQLQRGQQPLWNPYSYFGLPLAGMMQTGEFFPLSLIFHLFPFERALGPFLLANHVLGGLWTFLWLRRWGFGRWAGLTGSACFSLGGYALAYLQFPNLLGTVLQLPGLFLFWGHAWLLGLMTAVAFHAGYPVFWAASLLALFSVRAAWPMGADPSGQFRRSAAGVALGVALSAVLLAPGLELTRVSNRQGGVPSSERLGDSFSAVDFTAYVNPEVTRILERGPEPPRERLTLHWFMDGAEKSLSYYPTAPDPVKDRAGIKYTPWKSCYVGVFAFLLMLAGCVRLARSRPASAAGLLALAGAAAAVMMGVNARPSLWLWEHFTPLLYVRGPARFAFLPLAGMIPLIASGLDRLPGRARAVFAALVLAELSWTGRGFYPTMPRGYFEQRGSFAGFLGENIDGDRYFLYPRSDVWAYLDLDDPSEDYLRFKKMVYDTYKQKLFGVSNGVFHFYAATGDYESLFPDSSGRVIRLIRDADPRRLAAYLRWTGVRFWFNRDPLKGSGLIYQGNHLWHSYEVPGPVSVAYWLPASAWPVLERPFIAAPDTMKERAWTAHWPREDRMIVHGRAPEAGIVYLAEPAYPGWEAYLNGKRIKLRAAWDAFLACEAPAGEVSLTLLYRPGSWAAGLLVSLAALATCAAAGWGRRSALTGGPTDNII